MGSRYLKEVEWQILHAINLYIFRNGRDGEPPVLVHIPPEKKKTMKSVMKTIQERVRFPIGYAAQLYHITGQKVQRISELEQYRCYVVASNYDKHFISTQYGRRRAPLLVLNNDSKHVRFNSRTDNYERLAKKNLIGDALPECLFYNHKFNSNEDAEVEKSPPSPQRKNSFATNFKRSSEEFVVDPSAVADRLRMNEAKKTEIRPPVILQPHIKSSRTEGKGTWESNTMKSKWDMELIGRTESNGSKTYRCSRQLSDDNFDAVPETDSEDSLHDRFLEHFRHSDYEEFGHGTREAVPSRSYSILTHPLKNTSLPTNGIITNRLSHGKEMLVLPPPPPEFRDNNYLPEIDPFNRIHREPSETYFSSHHFKGLKKLNDPPFVLLEGQLRPQLKRLLVHGRDMKTNSPSEENISRVICKMVQGSGDFDNSADVKSQLSPTRCKTRPMTYGVTKSALGEEFQSREFSTFLDPCHPVPQGFDRMQKDIRKCSKSEELGKPSFETFVIHNRGIPNPGTQRHKISTRASYPGPGSNYNTTETDKLIKEILYRSLPLKYKNKYSSS